MVTGNAALAFDRHLLYNAGWWHHCGYCDRRFVLSHDHHAESEYLDPAARPPEAH